MGLLNRAARRANARKIAKAPKRAMVIESLEPRLLLSAGPVSQAALHAVQTNLTNLETVLQGLESVGAMGQTAALISANGSTTAGGITQIHSIFDNTIVSAIKTELAASSLSSDLNNVNTLASALQTGIQNILGTDDAQHHAAVTGSFAGTTTTLNFSITDLLSSSFDISLGTTGSSFGMSVPNSAGNSLATSYAFSFSLTVDQASLTGSSTPAQEAAAFHLTNASFATSFSATADLSGKEFDVGILALTVDPAHSVPISVAATLTASTFSATGAVLSSDASAINGGDTSSLTGGGALTTVAVSGNTNGTAAVPLLDLPLFLTDAHTIPGISTITSAVHVKVTGHEVGTDQVVGTTALVSALQTATGNPTFDPTSLHTFLPGDITGQLGKVGSYLDTLSQVPSLDITIPFTNGTTIGQVTDLATAFNDLLIKPLQATVGALGFTEGQISAGAGHDVIGQVLSPSDLSNLPAQIAMLVTLDNGKVSALKFAPTYLDVFRVARPIATVDNLVTALNAAIAASTLKPYIAAYNNGGAVDLRPISVASGLTAANKITVTSPSGSSLFSNIRAFGIQLANLLQLPGYDTVTTTPAEAAALGTTLLGELGLAYDANTNAITFSLSHQFTLPTVSTTADFNLQLGNVGNLAVTNATLSVASNVLLNLTVGLSLNPLGSDVNQPGGPTIGDGLNGTTDVKLADLPVVATASAGGTTPLTANAIKGSGTGLADIQIIGREGAVATVTIDPNWTLSNLETAIQSAFSNNQLNVVYDTVSHKIDITDTYAAYSGPSPTVVGLTSGTLASAAQVSGANYQAVLAGTAIGTPSWGTATKFIISVGSLAPVVVSVPASTSSATTFASALNTALAAIAVDPTQIGLAAGTTLNMGSLVHADVDSSGGIALKTTIYDAIHTALGADPSLSAQRVAVQWGLRVDPVDLMISAINGSLMPGVLGLVGGDINAAGSKTSEILGHALDGETLSDRLLLENTGISATVDVSLVPTDGTQPVVISGALGPMAFTAPLDPANVYVAITASLLMSDSANAVPNVVTLHQLTDSIAQGNFTSLWSFQLASGRAGQPFASLDITSIDMTVGSVDLAAAASPEIIITMDDPSVLLQGSAPTPHVEIRGFNATLAAADVLAAIQQTFDQLDGSLASAQIPLIGLSLDQILNFSTNFLVAVGTAQNDPAGTLTAIQTDMNTALGGNYVTLTQDASHNIIFHIAYTPASISTTLPFNLNLTDLTTFLGSDGGALSSLASSIGSIASASATGMLNVSAGVTMALTLGINLGASDVPAATSDLLSALNGGKGLRSGTAGVDDLKVTLGNGKSFTASVAGLGSTATVQNLVDLLNTKATAQGATGFATYDVATGKLTLTDSTTNPAHGLSALNLTAGIGIDNGTVEKVVGSSALTAAHAGDAYSFNVKIGAGVTAEVDVAADASRTTVADLVKAVRDAVNATTVSAKALHFENVVLPGNDGKPLVKDYQISLGQIVTVASSGGKLVLSAADKVLGTDGGGNVINNLAVADATPKATLKIESINTSHIATDLGLGSDSASKTTAGAARALTGTLNKPASASNRFFLETGNDSHGVPLTGVQASLGVEATKLNFTAGLGAFSAKVVGGTAVLGADVGKAAAGTAGFKVGTLAAAPAAFTVSLNDAFGGATAGAGILTFANLGQLGTPGNALSDLVKFTANAALDVNLPVTVRGQSLSPITLQIGNLFNTTNITGLPARTVTANSPSLSGLSLGSFLDDPQSVIDGLDSFLSLLSGGAFAKAIYNSNLPLVGPALSKVGGFFTTLHNDVIGTLQSMLDSFIADHPGQPATTQNIVTQGLNYVLGLIGMPGKIYSYIDSINAPTIISFVWQFSTTLLDTSVNLSTDLGIPGLGLSLNNAQAHIQVVLQGTLGFGYLKNKGFFVYDMGTANALTNFVSNNDPADVLTVNFRTTHALDLALAVSLPAGFSASINLGFLTAQATNGTTLSASALGGTTTITGTSLVGDVIADIGPNDTSTTGTLLFSQFGGGKVVRAYLATTLTVDLNIDTGFGFGSVSSAAPSVTTELEFVYSYDKAFIGTLPSGIVSGVVTPLTFVDVTLDLGSFLTKFLKPILDDLHKVTGPIQPFLDFLTAPIPGVSQIIGDTSLLDIAQTIGTPGIKEAVKFIRILDDITTLINTLDALANSGSGNIGLNFGTFVLGATYASGQTSLTSSNVDPLSSKGAVSHADTSAAHAGLTNASSSAASSKLNTVNAGGHNVGSQIDSLQSSKGAGGKPVIDFPILHDPMAVIGLLMGQVSPVDLVHVTLPTFSFVFSKSYDFHFFVGPVPVIASVYFSAGVHINLAFGYDTSGIMRYMSDHQFLDLLDGFYVDDTLGPQLSFFATIGVQAGVDLVLVAAGIGGEITGTVNFQLHDPSGTGKIHASVLLDELTHDPLKMFDISGDLKARIYAWFWVGIDFGFGKVTLYEGQFDILNVTLLSFSYSYAAEHSTPLLVHQVGTTASLNIGVNSDQQQNGGNLYSPDQTFIVNGTGGQGSSNSSTFTVAGNGGAPVSYSGTGKITADMGDGNNTVKFTGNVTADVTITGGSGNDTIDLSGVHVDPVITLGDGNNVITGAASDTTITVGNGNNIITGTSGRLTIYAGSGNNTIIGGTGADVIIVGTGDNTIWGGQGNDTIVAGGGNNTIWGGQGDNQVSIVNGAGNNVIFGNGPNRPTDPSTTTITATQISDNASSASDGNNIIVGGNGDDYIFGGGGNNTITGGAGHDVIFGSTGTVTLNGTAGVVLAVADSTVGGNNVITGGGGNSILFGGVGANTIASGSGNDVVVGNLGTVDGPAGGSSGLFTTTAKVGVGGADVITLGSGTDVVVAGIGANIINGGNGAEIIMAHEGVVVRDGALGRAVNFVSAHTTDETAGGDATVTGGTGNDFIFGGAGNNTIHAGIYNAGSGTSSGAGFNVILGGFGSVTTGTPGSGAVYQALTVTGYHGAAAGTGNSFITTDNTAIIMGGGGNNKITTSEGTLPQEVVFGANGKVVVDSLLAGGIALHTAQTQVGEEKIGGNNVIKTGDGADFVFGGAGTGTVTAGNGNDVIFGHIGYISLDQLATPDRTGLTPDIIGYFRSQDGVALATAGATIVAGNGTDVILGGAGNNTITAGTGTDIVFGAGGMITRDGTAGNALLSAQTTEESLSGNNTLTIGVGGTASDVIFGGLGHNTITAGEGANMILGHLGQVNLSVWASFSARTRADGSRPDVLGRYLPEIGSQVAGAPVTPGLDVIPAAGAYGATITAGGGNNVIIGGAGNNQITAGVGNNVVLGAAGSVTRDATTKVLVFTTTLEEQYGGDNKITVADGNNAVLGGIGNNLIIAGSRSNVLLGHLGQINYSAQTQFTLAQRLTGLHPDVIGRSLPELGNISPLSYEGTLGLDRLASSTSSTIYAGNGTNVIMGGAGNNTIVAGLGQNVIFGAAGAVTRNPLNGGIVYASTVEETIGGNNTITVGLRGLVGDIVFGGIGANKITVGGGNNIVLGHLGVVDNANMSTYTSSQRADGSKPDIWSRTVPELGNIVPNTNGGAASLNTAFAAGNDSIAAGNGNNIIMGGGGNNTITAGAGTNVVFGASGAVTRDARTGSVVIAQTVEENLGGNDVINVGIGARNASNTIFGGAGTNTIVAGGGNAVILGHLGTVNVTGFTLLSAAVRADGSHPDIISRTIPIYGNVGPVTTGGPLAGLNSPLPVAGGTITAGNGNDIILGGAGNNTITVGNGTDVVFGASGQVTRSATAGVGVIDARTRENALGGNDTITLGTGTDIAFGGAGSNVITTAGTADVIFGHTGSIHLVSGNQTLASGNSLSQLAQAALSVQAPLPPPVSPASAAIRPAGSTFILDATHGYWVSDSGHNSGPVLLLDGVDAPELILDLAAPIVVAGVVTIAA